MKIGQGLKKKSFVKSFVKKRSTLTQADWELIQETFERDRKSETSIKDPRMRTAVFLLYVTGLKISSLHSFKVKNIRELLQQGYTYFESINLEDLEGE